MNWRVVTVGLLLVALLVVPLASTAGAQPTQDQVKEAIKKGIEWLAAEQNDDGFWDRYEACAVTALAVKKLEHHAVDPKWGLGLPSPFHDDNPYKENIEKGLTWLFDNCVYTMDISAGSPHGDPDSDGDDIGVYFEDNVHGDGTHHRTYSTGIALMAICEAVEMETEITSGPLAGWTYEDVARDTMDYLAFGQNDAGWPRGGWGYQENDGNWSDQSNSGWVTLGLGFAEAPSPDGCGFEVPQFVKDELEIWIDYIQNDPGNEAGQEWCNADQGDCDGGSGYTTPWDWVNILKTGNLLQQMAFVGDTLATQRVTDALDYMARHWNDPNWEPGWRGAAGWPASYQATFTAMKGLTSFGLYHEFGDPPIFWQADFEETLLAEQFTEDPDDPAYGSWPWCDWGDDVLCTTWALLTLQKVAPPPAVPVDIRPQSCPNPLSTKERGVLPVAIVGTEDFDAGQIDPASIRLEGVAPLRWAWEDVAEPFEPYVGKEDCFLDCWGWMGDEAYPGDGYMDLTLKFKAQEVIAALGDVEDGDCLVLHLTGNLMDEYGGGPFVGEDVVWILKKGK
jgi:hypothetical protein